MKTLPLLLLAVLLTSCATNDANYIQRANVRLKNLPQAETESAEQKEVRSDHEKAFGRQIETLSQQDRVEPPALLKTVAPKYPVAERRARKTGTVHVAFIIELDGKVSDAKVISSTDPVFDAPALDAVRQWRYKPARKEGEPIAIAVTVPVVFQLR